jgi:hypothetical protein
MSASVPLSGDRPREILGRIGLVLGRAEGRGCGPCRSNDDGKDDMSVRRDLITPVLTGIVAIILERWIYNHSPALRSFVGADD